MEKVEEAPKYNPNNYNKAKQSQNKYQDEDEYVKPKPTPPMNKTGYSNKNIPPSSKSTASSNKRIPEKRQEYIPPKNVNNNVSEYRNQNEEVAIQPKADFYAMLEKEMKKESQNNGPSQYADDDGEMVQCTQGCERMFNSNAIAKH